MDRCEPAMNEAGRQRALYRVLVLGLCLAAWAILLYHLNAVPPGFQHDQMFNSLDALDVLSGRHQVYFPGNFGREPLGIYTAAGVFRLVGGHYVWSLRFSSVLWGMLGLAATISLGRRYLPRWGALFAAALMAGSFWFLFAARLGLEPMASLPLAMAMLYFLGRGLQRHSLTDLAIAGVIGGIALYTYLAPRVLLFLPPLLLAYELILAGVRRARAREPRLMRETRANIAGLLLCLLLMLLVSSPLLLYLRTHPGTADARVNELKAPLLAALRGDLGPVLGKARETALSILWAGPPAIPYQYNVPGRAALQPVWAICFLAGLVVTVARWLRLAWGEPGRSVQGDACPENAAAVTLGGLTTQDGLRQETSEESAAAPELALNRVKDASPMSRRSRERVVDSLLMTSVPGGSQTRRKRSMSLLGRMPPARHGELSMTAGTEFLLLAALALALVPVLLTGADALYMRGIIALPLLFILATRGLWAIGTAIQARNNGFSRSSAGLRRALIIVMLALLLWHLAESGQAYFVTWAQAGPTQRIYNADFRAAAAYLAEHPQDSQAFIGTDRDLDLDQKTYQLYEPLRRDVRWFDLPGNPPLPAEGSALYLWPASLPEPPLLTLLAGDRPDEVTIPERSDGSERSALLRGLRLHRADVEAVLGELGVRPISSPPIYGDTLRLDSAGVRDAGTHAELVTRWTALAPWPYSPPAGLPSTPPKLAAFISDASGYRWAQADVAATMPFRTWQPGDSLADAITVPLPADLPPGDYNVSLALYDDRAGTLAVQRDGARVATAPVVATLPASQRADRGAAPQPPHPVEPTTSEGLAALGKWEPLDTLLAGVPTDLHVSWQLAPGSEALGTSDIHFRLRALGSDGIALWEQPADPLMPLPPVWPAGQIYRLTHRVLPQTQEPGAVQAQVELCALRGETALACAVVGRPEVVNRPSLLALPTPPQHASGASWKGGPALAGYDLAQDGDAYVLTLYWRVENPSPVTLRRFVHAVDDRGQIVVQADGTPDNGGIPMSAWRSGEYVVDRVRLEPPAGQDVAEFYVGWYAPETGARLPVRLASGEALPDGRLGIPAH
jgi:hypothetical protein